MASGPDRSGDEPADHSFQDVREGQSFEREYVVTPAVYEGFLRTFDDRSPIHVDDAHARASGFAGRVMHGAILNGFVSHFVGMVFPGRRALLLSVDLRYPAPCYLGDILVLRAVVDRRVDSQATLLISVRFERRSDRTMVGMGKLQVRVREG